MEAGGGVSRFRPLTYSGLPTYSGLSRMYLGRGSYLERSPMRGAGRVVFAAVILMIVGTLNIIYGFGALDEANIFINDTRYILTTSTRSAGC